MRIRILLQKRINHSHPHVFTLYRVIIAELQARKSRSSVSEARDFHARRSIRGDGVRI